MAANANHFKLGLFVISATALGLIALGMLGAGTLLRETVTFETYIDESVQGLDVGAPVKIRGVQIGKVSRIDFVSNKYDTRHLPTERQLANAGLILVEFQVDRDFLSGRSSAGHSPVNLTQRVVDRGLRLRMASSGLTGPPFLSLDFLGDDAPEPREIDWTPQDIYVPSAPSTITQFVTKAENILASLENAKIQDVAADLRKLLKDLDGKVNELDLESLSGGASDLIDELRGTNQSLQKLLENQKVAAALDEAPAALADLRRLIRRADTLIATQSDDLRTIVLNLRQITDNLETLSESAKDYPSQLLLGEPPPKEEP